MMINGKKVTSYNVGEDLGTNLVLERVQVNLPPLPCPHCWGISKPLPQPTHFTIFYRTLPLIQSRCMIHRNCRSYKCIGKRGRILPGRRRGLAMKEGRWVGRMVGGDREGYTWAEWRRYKEKDAFGGSQGMHLLYGRMDDAFKWVEKDIMRTN